MQLSDNPLHEYLEASSDSDEVKYPYNDLLLYSSDCRQWYSACMSMNEQIPSEKRVVEFKSIDCLFNDKRTNEYWYPSLERRRAQKMESDNFDVVNRDYCIVRSPGKTSWQ